MARNQNVKRQHFIAPFSATVPRESEYLRLAQYITNISPNNEEEVELRLIITGMELLKPL